MGHCPSDLVIFNLPSLPGVGEIRSQPAFYISIDTCHTALGFAWLPTQGTPSLSLGRQAQAFIHPSLACLLACFAPAYTTYLPTSPPHHLPLPPHTTTACLLPHLPTFPSPYLPFPPFLPSLLLPCFAHAKTDRADRQTLAQAKQAAKRLAFGHEWHFSLGRDSLLRVHLCLPPRKMPLHTHRRRRRTFIKEKKRKKKKRRAHLLGIRRRAARPF